MGDNIKPLVNEFKKLDGNELQNSNNSILPNVFNEIRDIWFLTSLVLICFWIELKEPLPLVIPGIFTLSIMLAVNPENAPANTEVAKISPNK